jgi:hypothetical protein
MLQMLQMLNIFNSIQIEVIEKEKIVIIKTKFIISIRS